MGQTIPDVILTGGDYQDINTLTGIAVGTAVIVQFKSNYSALLQMSNTKPSAGSLDGNMLLQAQYYEIAASNPRLWVKGVGRLSVQVA